MQRKGAFVQQEEVLCEVNFLPRAVWVKSHSIRRDLPAPREHTRHDVAVQKALGQELVCLLVCLILQSLQLILVPRRSSEHDMASHVE